MYKNIKNRIEIFNYTYCFKEISNFFNLNNKTKQNKISMTLLCFIHYQHFLMSQ